MRQIRLKGSRFLRRAFYTTAQTFMHGFTVCIVGYTWFDWVTYLHQYGLGWVCELVGWIGLCEEK